MTKPQNRQELPLGHIIVATTDCPRGGKTFGFYATEAMKEKKRSIFSGHIEKGMADQLRLIAAQFDFIEQDL